jgi:hypothetical protein
MTIVVSAPVTLYTPSAAYGLLLATPKDVSPAGLETLNLLTWEALGYVRAVADMARIHGLPLDITHAEENAFTAAYRLQRLGSLRGRYSSAQSIRDGWDSWRRHGKVDHVSTLTRSSVVDDSRVLYGTEGIDRWVTVDGTQYVPGAVEVLSEHAQ